MYFTFVINIQFYIYFYEFWIEYIIGRCRRSEKNEYNKISENNKKTDISDIRNKIRYRIRRKTFESILRKPENRIYKNSKADILIFQKYNKHNYYIRKRERYSYEVKNTFEKTL